MVVGITEAKSHFVVSYGCRDARTGDPVNEKTTFEIGSITKLFTALLLADMANRGEVRVDEPVAELLPAGTRVPVRLAEPSRCAIWPRTIPAYRECRRIWNIIPVTPMTCRRTLRMSVRRGRSEAAGRRLK
jgi:hypothetical protein